MTRFVLQILLPLLLPTLMFLIWSYLARRRTAGGPVARLQEGPWFWLIVAGFVLMLGGLVYTAMTGAGDPEGVYEPPRYEDGRIVPGQIR